MNDRRSGRGQGPADPHPRFRQAALVAITVGVVLLAAAAFVLSYAGIHHIARAAGVPPVLARFYPLIFDAMLVVASAAALALRSAGWWTRCYVWLSLLLLLAAVAAGDAVHAMGLALPRKPSAAAVAVIPWILVLLAFGLLLAMLRQVRRARAAAVTAGPLPAGAASGAVTIVTPPAAPGNSQPARLGIDDLLDPRSGSAAPRLGDRLVTSVPPGAAIAAPGAATRQVTGPATGQAAAGQAATGQAATGQAATGEAATGEAATREAATREAATAATREAAAGRAAGAGAGSGADDAAAPPAGHTREAEAPAPGDGAAGQHDAEEMTGGYVPAAEDEDAWAFEDPGPGEEPEPEQTAAYGPAGTHEPATGPDEHDGGEEASDGGQPLPAQPRSAQFDRLHSTPTPPQE